MKKGWRIVITIVLVAALLGAVCVGVGLMTGADGIRIFSILDDRYLLTEYYDYAGQIMDIIAADLM